MRLLENEIYLETVERIAEDDTYSDRLRGKTFMISGATGMIGSFFIDVLMMKNRLYGLDINVVALGRNKDKAYSRFQEYWESSNFTFVEYTLGHGVCHEGKVDYIFHLASSTHPLQYSTDPVGTLLVNIEGLKDLLDYGKDNGIERFLFASSVEIYGENKGDVDSFDEKYLGYIDCNTMRACYPEGKRAAEALCQGYISQYGMDIVIPRLSRVYGPTMLKSDSKAIAQFIKKGIAGENIVLKSEGNQLYSYCYVADIASGLLKILFEGKNGEAYNVADPESDITLKELASKIASFNGAEVVFELPDEIERRGYSKATKATLNSSKLLDMGWLPVYGFEEGMKDTMSILKDIWNS